MSIGSKAEDPERLAAFVDWLYSPEGIRNNRAQTSGGMAGPEGLCWEYGEDGPYLTDFGKKALLGEDVEVPEEWGKGTWSEGISALNYSTVASCELQAVPEGQSGGVRQAGGRHPPQRLQAYE